MSGRYLTIHEPEQVSEQIMNSSSFRKAMFSVPKSKSATCGSFPQPDHFQLDLIGKAAQMDRQPIEHFTLSLVRGAVSD
jgi:hypothetical protein